MRKKLRYGWKRDLPDKRDYMFRPMLSNPKSLPDHVDLRGHMPEVYDQGEVGSCTANALGALVQYDQIKEAKPNFIPSRLFIYYNERSLEGETSSDSGAQIRDGIKALNYWGYCRETLWPYDPKELTVRPSTEAYFSAKKECIAAYQRVAQSEVALKQCLSQGYPIAFGFTVYESFESPQVAKTGEVPLPGNEASLGGHAVLLCGYDDNSKYFIVRNSWGKDWGIEGYFLMPYPYVLDPHLSADFWTITFVPEG